MGIVEDFINMLHQKDEQQDRLMSACPSSKTAIDVFLTHTYILDRSFRFLYTNPHGAKLLGVTPSAMIGSHWREIGLSPDVMEPIEQVVSSVLSSGQPVYYEIPLDRDTLRSLRYFYCEIIPLFGPDEKIEAALCSVKDITHYKRLVLQKQAADRTAEFNITKFKKYEREMSRLDRFSVVGEMAAALGHEVRNPMTTVRGYLQMFQMKQEFAKYREDFAIMIEELDRANMIISDFLSLAKDKTEEMKPANLKKTILSLFPLLQADAFRRGHALYADIKDIPDTVFDDKEIRQLVLNLVRNSLEAMEESGEVIIRTYRENGSINLEVQDTGPGIPDEVMASLGTPFVTTKANGTGLGLPVCYRIAERHGAKIEVDTSPQGTRFRVYFLPPPLILW